MNWLGYYNFFRQYGVGLPQDSQNKKRQKQAIENYKKYIAATPAQKQIVTKVSPRQLLFQQLFFPALGFTIGVLSSRMFVSPHSFYIGKFWTLFLVGVGTSISFYRKDIYNINYFAGNFGKFPQDIQNMLRYGDCRYARQWWIPQRFQAKLKAREQLNALQ